MTLLELLTAVSIILILAACWLSVSSSMKQRAASSLCAGKLRGISLGLNSYVADNSGKFLVAYNGYFGYWTDLLSPYMDGRKVDPINNTNLPAWILCPSKTGRTGYGWNYYHFGHNTSSNTNTINSRVSQVTEPSKTVIIGDSADDPADQQVAHQVIYGTASKMAKRHLGRGNYLFVDGHVEAISPTEAAKLLPRLFEKYPGETAYLGTLP